MVRISLLSVVKGAIMTLMVCYSARKLGKSSLTKFMM